MPSLAVVALISGGKDSFFSILHCLANGHNVVALANLYPPTTTGEEQVEDMDSFMYQTVGHTIIPLYAQALGLPLYRQAITGTAVNQNKSYGPCSSDVDSELDETESLLPLLQKVKEAHPQVNAISTGAILSDYQRTRVESVALRLGLIPLSFLWQWPSLPPYSEMSLLNDMALVGQDSRIIKVASGGLDDSFLWQNVADPMMRARLSKAAQRFGVEGDGALLGEGGEYETLAIDGPSQLWKARIEVDDVKRRVVLGEAGSASMRITRARIVTKDISDNPSPSVRIPSLWDPRFERMLEDPALNTAKTPRLVTKSEADELLLSQTLSDTTPRSYDTTVFVPTITGIGDTAAEQTRSIMEDVTERLSEYGHTVDHIAYTSIIMRDIGDFPAINAVYGSFFTKPNPPARVTIACADVLPIGAHLAMAFTSMATTAGTRKCLHVQSQSYWAPANIGPYSQAVSLAKTDEDNCSVIYIAGQIPLVPSSMALGFSIGDTSSTTNLRRQSALALQHLHRIGQAMQVKQWASVIAFIVAQDETSLSLLEHCARTMWTTYHEACDETEEEEEEEDANFDVWHASQRPTWSRNQSVANRKQPEAKRNTLVPPIYIVRVDALPREASIEWVGYGLTHVTHTTTHIPHLHHLLNIFKQRIVGSMR